MLNITEVPTHIMAALRQRRGLEADDTSQDRKIALLTPEEAFNQYCSWHGLINWGHTLVAALDDLRGAVKTEGNTIRV